tara:strand:+ start:202 stop:492 length:291 start_codon:yes stop_codon:yes gene_type:complete
MKDYQKLFDLVDLIDILKHDFYCDVQDKISFSKQIDKIQEIVLDIKVNNTDLSLMVDHNLHDIDDAINHGVSISKVSINKKGDMDIKRINPSKISD